MAFVFSRLCLDSSTRALQLRGMVAQERAMRSAAALASAAETHHASDLDVLLAQERTKVCE